MVRFVAAEGLEDAGYGVVEAASANEALDVLKSRSDVGVLFTDINMPGPLDGLALAELVHVRWPNISLVVTSGRSLERRVPEDGCFLTKPYTADEMTASIQGARRA